MDASILVALVREKMTICRSRLEEIGRALDSELGKSMDRRDPLVLAFLESQRQKFDYAMAMLAELSDAAGEPAPWDVGRPG